MLAARTADGIQVTVTSEELGGLPGSLFSADVVT
jgi:hypothetical protein